MKAGIRLRGNVRERPVSVDVPEEGLVVGSGPDCDLVLPDPTVSRRHARARAVGGALEVQDLGSTNGTWLEGRRVDRATVAPGGSVLFGRVPLMVEGVAAADRVVAVALEQTADRSAASVPPTPAAQPAETTHGMAPLDVAVDRLLPALIERLYERSDAADLARWAGSALYQLLTLRGLEIEDERGGVLFSSGQLRESEAVTESRRGRIAVRATSARRSGRGTLAQLVDSLAAAVALASERERPLPRPQEAPKPPELPGAGSVEPTVLEIFERAQRVAPGEVGVLILGESGTGKEVLARYIHDASGRERWVALNCAALPRDLLEAELFGVEKGTATGVEARPGKLELADGGTLFLDEIGDMSLETQAKILRVLQEGEVYRLGASQPRPARARVLSATNQDLRQLLSEGRFRLDLYHRIAGWVVELPPLRERTGDIPGLAGLFLAEEGRKLGRRFRGISRGALDTLLACPWPGNIRQLRQEVARCALFMEEGSVLEATLLGPEIREETAETTTQAPLADRLQAYERREIERTLAACGGQVSRAAEVLGMHRASLYRRMKTLGIDGSG